ncbi:hypothetical protein [Paracoccus sp. SJTW-4]|uniref:hypothetical protein n=1 Tax=Paracoccus sp. SJTW-4 TaxID=3078428 RepID=UPI0039E9370A
MSAHLAQHLVLFTAGLEDGLAVGIELFFQPFDFAQRRLAGPLEPDQPDAQPGRRHDRGPPFADRVHQAGAPQVR